MRKNGERALRGKRFLETKALLKGMLELSLLVMCVKRFKKKAACMGVFKLLHAWVNTV